MIFHHVAENTLNDGGNRWIFSTTSRRRNILQLHVAKRHENMHMQTCTWRGESSLNLEESKQRSNFQSLALKHIHSAKWSKETNHRLSFPLSRAEFKSRLKTHHCLQNIWKHLQSEFSMIWEFFKLNFEITAVRSLQRTAYGNLVVF